MVVVVVVVVVEAAVLDTEVSWSGPGVTATFLGCGKVVSVAGWWGALLQDITCCTSRRRRAAVCDVIFTIVNNRMCNCFTHTSSKYCDEQRVDKREILISNYKL